MSESGSRRMMRRALSGVLWSGCISLTLAGAAAASDPEPRPIPVAPGSTDGEPTLSQPCPSFHWADSVAALGYELAVFELESDSKPSETTIEPVLRHRVPGSARGWELPADRCLVPGSRYAWAVRDLASEGEWSEAAAFEVAVTPSPAEVEAALGVLRRYLADHPPGAGEAGVVDDSPSTPRLLPPAAALLPRPAEPSRVAAAPAARTAPALGAASLTVDGQLHLGANGDLFRDGDLFLWADGGNLGLGAQALGSTSSGDQNTAVGVEAAEDNTTGSSNTAVGREALARNQTGSDNTAVGDDALKLRAFVGDVADGKSNTAVGSNAMLSGVQSSFNTAIGHDAMVGPRNSAENTAVGHRAFETGYGNRNTAIGQGAMRKSTTADNNTALGEDALWTNTTGSNNIAVGRRAGFDLDGGVNNIYIGNEGGASNESGAIRIGSDLQVQTYLAGVRGATASGGLQVLVSADGKLGTTTSSRRFKEEIRELGTQSGRLALLRPVSFRYRSEVAGSADRPVELGLIAEEVEAVFPELVTVDAEGRPDGVRYHLLPTLLLSEWQRQREALATQAAEIERLSRRLAGLEGAVP